MGDRRPALEAGQRLGQRVAAVDLGRPVGADDERRSVVGAGDALEDRDALGVGPVEVVEDEHRRSTAEDVGRPVARADVQPGRRGAPADRPGGAAATSRSSSAGSSSRRTSRSSSKGRPRPPGSAWPASTRVSSGRPDTSSRTSRVLPTPASPPTSATPGVGSRDEGAQLRRAGRTVPPSPGSDRHARTAWGRAYRPRSGRFCGRDLVDGGAPLPHRGAGQRPVGRVPVPPGDIVISHATQVRHDVDPDDLRPARLPDARPRPRRSASSLPGSTWSPAPRTVVFATSKAQTHRRFIKTHTPLDGLPQADGVTYICVGRDPRDVALSMDHHRANLDFVEFARGAGRGGRGSTACELEPLPPDTAADRRSAVIGSGTGSTTTATRGSPLSTLRYTLYAPEAFLRSAGGSRCRPAPLRRPPGRPRRADARARRPARDRRAREPLARAGRRRLVRHHAPERHHDRARGVASPVARSPGLLQQGHQRPVADAARRRRPRTLRGRGRASSRPSRSSAGSTAARSRPERPAAVARARRP